MDLVKRILELLNNSSVAAFLGAFCAFLLVVLTDARRKGRRRQAFQLLLVDAVGQAARTRPAVLKIQDLLKSKDTIQPGAVRKFPVPELTALKLEIYEAFSAPQISALESLLFLMQAANDMLDMIARTSEGLYEVYLEKDIGPNSLKLKKKLLVDLHGAASQLDNIGHLGELYFAGSFQEMAEWRYTPVKGEEILAGRDA
jgi:hypothetical protein